jgi:hypothetical protein
MWNYKSLGVREIQTGGNKEEFSQQWKESIILSVYRKCDKNV